MTLIEPDLDRSVLDALRELPSPDGRSMIACVAELFAQDSPALLQQMQHAVQGEDWLALAAAAHPHCRHKTSRRALRFMAQLRELELTAKAGDSSGCIALLAPVPEACRAVVAALTRESACL